MVNYYDLLGIPRGATETEIGTKLKEKKRIWTQRQNAPKPEQQQEASNNLRLVPQIEATLLNSEKRAAYDRQLDATPREEEHAGATDIASDDLIQEGWRMLSVGNVPGALMVATKATETQGSNPDAWALLGYCKAQWGEIEDAIYEYKRAIKLRPNDASLFFDLGSIYEGIEQWEEAMQQYQRAAQIDANTTVYRAAMGSVFIKNEMYDEGIKILQDCLREEPENEGYKYLLAIAYADSGYQNWTLVSEDAPVSPGYYATTNAQVSEAEELIEKAESLGVEDSDIRQHLAEVRQNIADMRKRRFHGNLVAAGGAIIIGLLMLFVGDKESLGVGVYLIVCGGLYIVSCMTPQYRLNRRIIEGRAETSGGLFREMGAGEGGVVGAIISFFIIISLLPIMTAWNLFKNYAVKK